jgi:signal transduction histidine kinase
LPRPPGVIRRFFQTRPWVTDSLVAVLYLLGAGGLAIAATPESAPLWAVVLLALAGTATLLFRRRKPVLVFAIANVLYVLSTLVGTTAESLMPLLAIYAVGVYRSSRAAWACFGLGSAVAALDGLLLAWRTRFGPSILEPIEPPVSSDLFADWANNSVGSIVMLLIATLIGTNIGGRVRYVAALVDRAAQLARERDQQAEIASAQERERIAREMHDVIAHSLSVMIALSEGANAAAESRPEQAKIAMGRAAETGRRTLGEVRRLLASVRSDREHGEVEHTPQPGAGDVVALVEEFSRAGLPVRLAISGAPAADAALGLTVYRILQESLTNALRHAGGATEVVARVDWTTTAVDITVEDDAPQRIGDGSDPGRGLVGIRERASLYGGEAQIGPRGANGWRVFVHLPRKGEVA